METSSQKREQFGSRLGIIAAAAGSAIGLGNIWRFPFMTGENGGAAFIIVYLICIALIGIPVMLSEFIIGRRAQKNVVSSFKVLAPGKPWFLVGWMGMISAFMILAFYGVVAGWTLEYILKSLTNSFAGKTPQEVGAMFGGFISNPLRPLFWQFIFMFLAGWIIYSGVTKGIERYSKILMPLLILIIIILDIRAITLPGASGGIEFLFKPDFSKLTALGFLNALGHAFFSLSLGMGVMITYGSYVSKKEHLGNATLQVTIADTAIALMAGLAIFPAVFAFSIKPSAGPGLVFVTLPNVFLKMPGGYIFSLLFFVLLAIAALTSAISILEVVVAYVSEDFKIARHKATIIITAAITLLGIPCSLSMGVMSNVKFFGKTFFDLLDFASSNVLLILGGFFITLFVAWHMGKDAARREVTNEGSLPARYYPYFLFVAKYIAPVAILIVFLHGLGIVKV